MLDRAPPLRLFAYGAGTVKWQVTDAVFERGIVVTSAAAANAVPVAEYTVAAILLANKGVFVVREQQRDPEAQRRRSTWPGSATAGPGSGIVGASFVGRLVIDALRATDLEVAVYDPYLSVDEADALGVEKVDDLDALCASVRLLSIHAPDIPPTRGMIGAAQLAALPDGATVVNTARPALVDQDALVAELTAGPARRGARRHRARSAAGRAPAARRCRTRSSRRTSPARWATSWCACPSSRSPRSSGSSPASRRCTP